MTLLDRPAGLEPPDGGAKIVVVVPAYRTSATLADVITRIPPLVRHVLVVDDASPDDLGAAATRAADPRVELLRHAVNRGVGGACKTGFARALELGADVVVKLDSDGQMDPARIPALIAPLLAARADLVKGNRFWDFELIDRMPATRRWGNLGLSFLVKLASGYWTVFDPCNGFVAMTGGLLARLRREQLAERYFFEISLLCESYLARAVVRDLPMPPVYGDEVSSLSPAKSFFEFVPKLLARAARRIGLFYFVRDFNLVSVFLLAGLPLLLFGGAWSAVHWARSLSTGVVASTGTVVVGLLPIILGFQLLLQAVVLDVQNEPGRSEPGQRGG
jgi:glycosyltransferase involved in cell wall biosynthesis